MSRCFSPSRPVQSYRTPSQNLTNKMNVLNSRIRRATSFLCFVGVLLVLVSWWIPDFSTQSIPSNRRWTIATTLSRPWRMEQNATYAIATVLSLKDHELAAMTLCHSLRRGDSMHIDIVVLVTQRDTREPPPSSVVLARCFDRVLFASAFPSESHDEQRKYAASLDVLALFALVEYRRIVFLEVDTLVLRPFEIFALVRTPIKFGAVQNTADFDAWQGGVAVFEPDATILKRWMMFDHPRDSERAFTMTFPHDAAGIVVLPPAFDVEPIYESHSTITNPIVIHYSVRKPWRSICFGGAHDVWWRIAWEAKREYGVVDERTLARRMIEWIDDWGLSFSFSCGTKLS